jgi:hypothetical protein
MRTMIAMAAGALLLGGCITEEMVEKGRLPEPRVPHEERDHDYVKNRRDACKTPNTDEYLECLARYERGERDGGTVTYPLPKSKPVT